MFHTLPRLMAMAAFIRQRDKSVSTRISLRMRLATTFSFHCGTSTENDVHASLITLQQSLCQDSTTGPKLFNNKRTEVINQSNGCPKTCMFIKQTGIYAIRCSKLGSIMKILKLSLKLRVTCMLFCKTIFMEFCFACSIGLLLWWHRAGNDISGCVFEVSWQRLKIN